MNDVAFATLDDANAACEALGWTPTFLGSASLSDAIAYVETHIEYMSGVPQVSYKPVVGLVTTFQRTWTGSHRIIDFAVNDGEIARCGPNKAIWMPIPDFYDYYQK